jgi:hypothetical protein
MKSEDLASAKAHGCTQFVASYPERCIVTSRGDCLNYVIVEQNWTKHARGARSLEGKPHSGIE